MVCEDKIQYIVLPDFLLSCVTTPVGGYVFIS